MKRGLVLLALGFLIASSCAATEFYIPHIHVGDDAWETYLILDNSNEFPVRLQLELYQADGEIETLLEIDLDALESRAIALREYGGVAGTVKVSQAHVQVRVGYAAKNGGVAEFGAPRELQHKATLSLSDYYDELTWAGFAIFNPSDDTELLSIYGHFRNGTRVYMGSRTLGPRQKWVDYFNTALDADLSEIAAVEFRVNDNYTGITGIRISGKENDRLLFTQSTDYDHEWEVELPILFRGEFDIGAFCNGLLFVNVFPHPSTIYNYSCRIVEVDDAGGYQEQDVIEWDRVRVYGAFGIGTDICLYGEEDGSYFVGRYNHQSRSFKWKRELGTCPDDVLAYRIPALRKMSVARQEVWKVAVYYTDSDQTLQIRIIDLNNGGTLSNKQIQKYHLLGDGFCTGYKFGIFFSERLPAPATTYNRVWLYEHDLTDASAGTFTFWDLKDLDPDTVTRDATERSVIQAGIHFYWRDPSILYTTFQVCCDKSLGSSVYSGDYVGTIPAYVIMVKIDLNTHQLLESENTFATVVFGADTVILDSGELRTSAFYAPYAMVVNQRLLGYRTTLIPFYPPPRIGVSEPRFYPSFAYGYALVLSNRFDPNFVKLKHEFSLFDNYSADGSTCTVGRMDLKRLLSGE